MPLSDKPLNSLLAEFRSSAPTPGGGSAAALSGAVGASLLAMVAALPKPRAAGDADLQALRRAGEQATDLARDLERLIDRDSEAYNLVMGAYRLPKETDGEKSARATAIQAALKQAISAPLDVMRACASGLALSPIVAAHGNANAASDVQVGVELLRAALRGARLNVEINLGSVKDPSYVQEIRREVERLSESGAAGAPSASA